MMLTCADQYVNSSIVPYQIPYGEPLHLSLIQYCELPGGGSTSASIKTGINNWGDMQWIMFGSPKCYNAAYMYVFHYGYVANQINLNRTCVVTLGQILGSPYGNHVVMVYGYDIISGSKYFRSHIGWSGTGNSDTWINASWSIGATWLNY